MRCDFHAHVLPGIDHGSHSTQETAAQLSLLSRSGVTHVVASPHFYPDEWSDVQSFLSFRREGEERILPLLENKEIKVFCGAEVLLSEGLDHLDNIQDLCISGTNVLLLEMPFFKWNERLYRTVSNLCRSGLCVLLAHVDRYPLEDVKRLFDMGAVGQVNCSVFAHLIRRRIYRSFVREGYVRALGSDIHRPADFREKNIARATSYLGDALMEKLDAFGLETLFSAKHLSLD